MSELNVSPPFFFAAIASLYRRMKSGVPDHQGKDNVLLFSRYTSLRRGGHVQCRERLGGLLRY
jgi:hypothetical protein